MMLTLTHFPFQCYPRKWGYPSEYAAITKVNEGEDLAIVARKTKRSLFFNYRGFDEQAQIDRCSPARLSFDKTAPTDTFQT